MFCITPTRGIRLTQRLGEGLRTLQNAQAGLLSGLRYERAPPSAQMRTIHASSLASMVIFAFSTLESGHPAFALLAAASKAWRFAPGIFAVVSR